MEVPRQGEAAGVPNSSASGDGGAEAAGGESDGRGGFDRHPHQQHFLLLE